MEPFSRNQSINPHIEIHDTQQQPKDTVSSIVWADDTLFYLSTWAGEILGYQIVFSETMVKHPCPTLTPFSDSLNNALHFGRPTSSDSLQLVYRYQDTDDRSIMCIDVQKHQSLSGEIAIAVAFSSGEVAVIGTQSSKMNVQYTSQSPIGFVKLCPHLGLISVDFTETIRINGNIINAGITPFSSATSQSNSNGSTCKIFADSSQQCALPFLGCAYDHPYLLVFDMSEFIYLIDLTRKKFSKVARPFHSSYPKCGSIIHNNNSNSSQSDEGSGQVVLGSFDGQVSRLSFRIIGATTVIWDYDYASNKLGHFTTKNIEQMSQDYTRSECDRDTAVKSFLFSVNAVGIIHTIGTHQKQQLSKQSCLCISAGGEGKLILWQKPTNRILANHQLMSISVLALSPSMKYIAYSVGYDWHKGIITTHSYSPSVHVIPYDVL